MDRAGFAKETWTRLFAASCLYAQDPEVAMLCAQALAVHLAQAAGVSFEKAIGYFQHLWRSPNAAVPPEDSAATTCTACDQNMAFGEAVWVSSPSAPGALQADPDPYHPACRPGAALMGASGQSGASGAHPPSEAPADSSPEPEAEQDDDREALETLKQSLAELVHTWELRDAPEFHRAAHELHRHLPENRCPRPSKAASAAMQRRPLGPWVNAAERLPTAADHPDGPTRKDEWGRGMPQDHVRCLVVLRDRPEPTLLMWNLHHLCWDDESGDDFLWEAGAALVWMPAPAPPPLPLSSNEAGRG